VRTAVLAATTLALCACAPAEDPPFAYATLDCAQPFDAQNAKLTAQPLNAAPKDRNEPYRYYSSPDGRVSYLITEPSAPGHPAVMMQQVNGADVVTTGCPYGDQAGYDQLHAYLDSLKSWRRK
jgi:hypothetical protein